MVPTMIRMPPSLRLILLLLSRAERRPQAQIVRDAIQLYAQTRHRAEAFITAATFETVEEGEAVDAQASFETIEPTCC